MTANPAGRINVNPSSFLQSPCPALRSLRERVSRCEQPHSAKQIELLLTLSLSNHLSSNHHYLIIIVNIFG